MDLSNGYFDTMDALNMTGYFDDFFKMDMNTYSLNPANFTEYLRDILRNCKPIIVFPKDFVFEIAFVTFLKSFYVTVSIIQNAIPPSLAVGVFSILTIFYWTTSIWTVTDWIFNLRNICTLVFQIANLAAVFYTLFKGVDGIFLLAVLPIMCYKMKPFSLALDILAILAIAADTYIAFWENWFYWKVSFIICIGFFIVSLNLNSIGLWTFVVIFDLIAVYFLLCLVRLSECASRVIPMCLLMSLMVLNGYYMEYKEVAKVQAGFDSVPSEKIGAVNVGLK